MSGMPVNNDIKRIKLLFTLIMLVATGICSCSFSTDHPGFSKTVSGIFYRLNIIGEGNVSPVPGDYITVDLVYSTMADSMFFSARRKFRLEEPSYVGSVEECFAMMRTGDETDFILNAGDFFIKTLGTGLPGFLKATDNIRISVRMTGIQTGQSYLEEKQAFLSWIEDFGEYERIMLKNFIRNEQIEARPDSTGLYFILITEGSGKRIEHGDTIEIHYEGKFLDGRFFDSTRKRDEVFELVYGQEWQLLEGLDRAVGLMKEGDKALVIIPSVLGFGIQGSSTGIIPPYTSLVYEVEVLSVR